MVEGETRRIANRGEKNGKKKILILWVFGWREWEDGKWLAPGCFLPWPTIILSHQFGEKIEEREIIAINDWITLFLLCVVRADCFFFVGVGGVVMLYLFCSYSFLFFSILLRVIRADCSYSFLFSFFFWYK